MHDLLKILPIYSAMILSSIMFSFFNFTFWLSKLKSGTYTLPFIDKSFQTWWGFTLAAWFFNATFCYIWATLLVGLAYKMSIDKFGVLMSAFIVSQIVSAIVPLFFLCYQTGETPNRQEAIALILIFSASLILANSRN